MMSVRGEGRALRACVEVHTSVFSFIMQLQFSEITSDDLTLEIS